ncbi:hypothetical protein ACFSMW_09280 [Virgibacillus halophilus]|uniref:Fur-regulated basic protein A n=1 Tax=Tigheibacillus halophilus TaxID=361280 RepID=A0ABU5C4N1_9BACI|nr:hypothetical protein [Virgibacillus halophilus]
MKDFLQLLIETEQELGRQLSKEETAFLQWVFNRQSMLVHHPDEKTEVLQLNC